MRGWDDVDLYLISFGFTGRIWCLRKFWRGVYVRLEVHIEQLEP